MPFRTRFLISLTGLFFAIGCRTTTADTEIRHDLKYFAAFASPAILTPDDEKRFSNLFQSKYKNRVAVLHPVTAQATLPLLNAKVSLFAVIRVSALREAKAVTRELEQALGGTTIALFPLVESISSQDNFSGQVFYLALEKRSPAFMRMSGLGKLELLKAEAEELGRDRNMLSYFSASLLSDTPYQTLHIMGFSGAAESEYQTLEGLYSRAVKKLDAADTVLTEKLR